MSSDSRKHHFREMLPEEEEGVYREKVVENCLNTVQALLGSHGVSPLLCSIGIAKLNKC